MKVVLQDGRRCILRFDRDEEVIGGLAEFAQINKINAAVFFGIGACSKVELGFYNDYLKDYRHKPFVDNREILSLNGNISQDDGKPVVHAHGVFSNSDFETIGGHVFKIVVSVTCEIFFIKLEGRLQRRHDEKLNLNLLYD